MEPLISANDTLFSINLGTTNTLFHFVWLRDNCVCPKCIHPSSKQKLFSSAAVPIDIKPVKYTYDENLKVEWTDGHTSEYSKEWLKNNSYSEQSQEQWHESRKPVFWHSGEITDKHVVSYNDFMENDAALMQALSTFISYGILFLSSVPNDTEAIERVALRIGPIRETFFGRTWDVKNIPQAHNIAYTAVNLGLHQDLPYFESVPPVQILHCMVASGEGGESTFADSYLAAERLREKYPEHFETLLRVPITLQYTNNGHNFVCQKPVLYRNENLYIGVNFSPQNHGPMKVAPQDVIPFYAAYKQLSDEIYNSNIIYAKKLKSGDLVMFDNRRVLHGRNSFDPTAPRHLRGTYLGMDEVEDRFHTLKHSLSK